MATVSPYITPRREPYKTKINIYLTIKGRIRIDAGGQMERLRYLVGGARWSYNPHKYWYEGNFNMRNLQKIYERVAQNERFYELNIDPRIQYTYDEWDKWRKSLLEIKKLSDYDLSDIYFRHDDLRPYQRVDVAFLSHGGPIDGCEMGLGKTVECCAVVDIWTRQNPDLKKGLIVAPTNALHIWRQHLIGVEGSEIKKPWTHFDKSQVFVADQPLSEDKLAPIIIGQSEEVGPAITVIPWSALQNDQLTELLGNFEYDWIIIDETHRGRNPKAKQSRAFQKLNVKKRNEDNSFFSYKLETSGTPVVNYGSDLYPLVHWPMPTQYDDFESFKEDFVYKPGQDIDYWRYKRDIKKEKLDALHNELDYLLIERRLKDVLKEVPESQQEWVNLKLNPWQRKLYEQMRDEFVIELEDMDEEIDAMTALTRLMRLKQLAISPSTIEITQKKPKDLTEYDLKNDDSSKFDWIMDFIEDTEPEDKIVIFSQFASAISILENRIIHSPYYKKNGYAYCVLTGQTRRICFQEFPTVEELETQFQEKPNVKIWMGTLKASGESLTLTAAHKLINIDQWWNGATMDQAAGRLIRHGQTKGVIVYNLVAQDTVEQDIIERVLKRRDLFNRMIRTKAYLMELLLEDQKRKERK